MLDLSRLRVLMRFWCVGALVVWMSVLAEAFKPFRSLAPAVVAYIAIQMIVTDGRIRFTVRVVFKEVVAARAESGIRVAV